MRHHRGWGFRGALLAAAAGTVACSTIASAQSAGENPGAALRRQLIELAANPSNVVELVETGRAALAVGDGEAALGFFTRAAQLSPRDYRVKAGLAAAHARTGRPETALVLFSEAASLGAPDGELAGERGLTYDLLGQTARAQQDYLASLRYRENPEVRRRLALSLAISGQKDAALRLLDPQLRSADRAALRARVMVLALAGDVAGATAAAKASMPLQAAQAITPFLPRLASLSPGQKASAANLGRVPGSGGTRTAQTGAAAAYPGAVAFAGGAPSLANRLPVAPVSSTASRRRPGGNETASARTVRRRSAPAATETGRWNNASSRVTRPAAPPPASSRSAPTQPVAEVATASVAQVATASVQSAALFLPHPHEPFPAELRLTPAAAAPAARVDAAVAYSGAASPQVPVATPVTPSGSEPGASSGVASLAAPVTTPAVPETAPQAAPISQLTSAPASTQTEVADTPIVNPAAWSLPSTPSPTTTLSSATAPSSATTPSPAPAPAERRPGFSDVVATISSLPTETAPTAAPAPAPTRAPAPARTAEPKREQKPATPSRDARSRAGERTAAVRTPPKPRVAPARPAHPARVWVQLAYSPNRAAFGHEMKRVLKAAPELLRGRTPHAAATGDRHRLLIGPFKDDAAARSFINDLKKKEVDALAWTSPAGTEVARFSGK